MTLAPAVTTRRVYGRALELDGTPALGVVEFFATVTQTDAADNVTVVDGAITTPVDPNTGDWSIVVPVTDEPDLAPGIGAFAVRLPGARSVRTIAVPTPAGSDTGDLAYTKAEDAVIVPAAMIGIALTGITMGRVTTLPPGSLGTARLVGGAPEPELEIGIPQGPKGDRPVVTVGTVTTGAPGSSAQITWSGVGSVAAPYVLNFVIPRGDVGLQGPQPQMRAGDVTKIAAGGTPTVTITGDGTPASPYSVNLGLVTGDKGAPGDKGDAGGIDLANSTGVLPLSKGGTGSTTAAAARTALGVQPKYGYYRSYQSSFSGSPRLAAFVRQTSGAAPAASDAVYATPAAPNSKAGAITISEAGLYVVTAAWKAGGDLGAGGFANIGVATQAAVDTAAGGSRAVYPSESSMYTIGTRSSDGIFASAALAGVYLAAGAVLEFPTHNGSGTARTLEVLVSIAKVG
ncbi:hypothetical protein GCM10027298_22580 [Epidermidibacterium keratini]